MWKKISKGKVRSQGYYCYYGFSVEAKHKIQKDFEELHKDTLPGYPPIIL